MDPLLAVLGGSGLVLYVAMWIIVPKEPLATSARRLRSGQSRILPTVTVVPACIPAVAPSLLR